MKLRLRPHVIILHWIWNAKIEVLYILLYRKRFHTAYYHIRLNFKFQEEALFKIPCVKESLRPHVIKVYRTRCRTVVAWYNFSHCKSLKTNWEKNSWFEKFVLKSRKYQNAFLKTRKINSLRKIFLSLLQEDLTWTKNISQNKTNFLNIKKTFLSKKIFLVSRRLFLFWEHFLKLR